VNKLEEKFGFEDFIIVFLMFGISLGGFALLILIKIVSGV